MKQRVRFSHIALALLFFAIAASPVLSQSSGSQAPKLGIWPGHYGCPAGYDTVEEYRLLREGGFDYLLIDANPSSFDNAVAAGWQSNQLLIAINCAADTARIIELLESTASTGGLHGFYYDEAEMYSDENQLRRDMERMEANGQDPQSVPKILCSTPIEYPRLERIADIIHARGGRFVTSGYYYSTDERGNGGHHLATPILTRHPEMFDVLSLDSYAIPGSPPDGDQSPLIARFARDFPNISRWIWVTSGCFPHMFYRKLTAGYDQSKCSCDYNEYTNYVEAASAGSNDAGEMVAEEIWLFGGDILIDVLYRFRDAILAHYSAQAQAGDGACGNMYREPGARPGEEPLYNACREVGASDFVTRIEECINACGIDWLTFIDDIYIEGAAGAGLGDRMGAFNAEAVKFLYGQGLRAEECQWLRSVICEIYHLRLEQFLSAAGK